MSKHSQELNATIPERFECALQKDGIQMICGCDEAGRGPLAGPVVGAVVLFKDCDTLWRCRDSKSISSMVRERLAEEIRTSLVCAFAAVSAEEIDRTDIRIASLLAMKSAIEGIGVEPHAVFVDGRDKIPGVENCHAIIKGDVRVATISAASIIAKVERDRTMREYHLLYPQYGFDRNMGYPTAEHRRALKLHGPCPIHRKSFHGVLELVV
ncbi:ribonuclease HII [bacterium]|nr:ribonuclease HII [bacterium]